MSVAIINAGFVTINSNGHVLGSEWRRRGVKSQRSRGWMDDSGEGLGRCYDFGADSNWQNTCCSGFPSKATGDYDLKLL